MTSHSTLNSSIAMSSPILISTPKSKPTSNFRVLPCDPKLDGPAILTQQTAAFSDPREPFFFVLFPETEETEKAVRRLVDIWLGDEKARYVKVVNEEGTLISAAKWLINTEPLSEEQKKEHISVDWHPDQDSNEWAEYLINWIHKNQISRTKGEPCVILDMLSTHPSYQHLGAGTLLMQYGTAIADSLNLPAFVEGTAIAKHLYESHGFRAVPDRYIEVEVPEKWREREDRPKIEYFFYERPRGAGKL
ncbi:2488cd33-e6a8-49a4-968a-2870a04c78cf [Sclerotinia trifoliorum]|uniref:2488cd33-e6a8-49a4-968a-2870a04c78cf n=1 Tax=Sclerotinia trifoliorum TaxID=28548 RepID=A0A8H2VYM7_9HELO|nr:2488cd33-e6a8-49a4-968a-2870a04c78cf [Sclerotinia trifoliorum]